MRGELDAQIQNNTYCEQSFMKKKEIDFYTQVRPCHKFPILFMVGILKCIVIKYLLKVTLG